MEVCQQSNQKKFISTKTSKHILSLTQQKNQIMKTLFISTILALSSVIGFSQEKKTSPAAIAKKSISGVDIEIHYSQPSVKGREIWGELVPFGKVWRTGANEATTISFSEDVTILGQNLASGTYALFTIPTEDNFTFIFNTEAKQWGAYKYDESKDALRVENEAREVKEKQEMMTFTIAEDGMVSLHWENMVAEFQVKP